MVSFSRSKSLALALIIGLSIPVSIGSGAVAQEADATTSDVYVLNESGPGVEHTGTSTFYPLPQDAEEALVVTEEIAEDLGIESVGSLKPSDAQIIIDKAPDLLSGKISPSPAQAVHSSEVSLMADGGWTAFSAGAKGAWGPFSRARNHWTGSYGWDKYYEWASTPWPDSKICGQGTGWYRGYNGSQFGIWSKVYSLGCGGSGFVPWDNTIAYPTFRGANMYMWPAAGNFR